jgi:predicted protein tyrosine phosphatase
MPHVRCFLNYELIPRLHILASPEPAAAHDPGSLYVDRLLVVAREVTISATHVPLDDDGIHAPDPEAVRTAVDLVKDWLDDGYTVGVACLAGMNRSALVGACVMIERGYSPQDALDLTTRARPGMPALSNAGCRAMVLGWRP